MKLLYFFGILFYFLRILREDFTSRIDFFILFLLFFIQLSIDMVNNLFPSVFRDLLSDNSYGKTSMISLILSQNSALPALIMLNIFILYSFYGSRGSIRKDNIKAETTTQTYLRILVNSGF